jgi:hypothetical protein
MSMRPTPWITGWISYDHSQHRFLTRLAAAVDERPENASLRRASREDLGDVFLLNHPEE